MKYYDCQTEIVKFIYMICRQVKCIKIYERTFDVKRKKPLLGFHLQGGSSRGISVRFIFMALAKCLRVL